MSNLPVVPNIPTKYKVVLSVIVLLSLLPMVLPVLKAASSGSLPSETHIGLNHHSDRVQANTGKVIVSETATDIRATVKMNIRDHGQDVLLTLVVILSVTWQGLRYTLKTPMPRTNKEKFV